MTTFQDAVRALLDAADAVAAAGTIPAPPAGEWDAEQILAHVSLVNAATIATAAAVAAGSLTTYDNRLSQDPWTIARTIERAGAGLRERIRLQGVALDAFGGTALSDAELDTRVPALLISGDAVLVDQPLTLRDILGGLAAVELPGHTNQLLALLPDHAVA